MKEKNISIIQLEEWKKRSECGEVCGIFGCEDKPTVHCPRCGNWYCYKHSFIHLHVNNEGNCMMKIIIVEEYNK